MSCLRTVALVLVLAVGAHGAQVSVDCSTGGSLQSAVADAIPGTTITATGSCQGPITIVNDGLKIQGTNSASISATNADVVTVNGAKRTQLNGFTIKGGNNGIVVQNESQVSVSGTDR